MVVFLCEFPVKKNLPEKEGRTHTLLIFTSQKETTNQRARPKLVQDDGEMGELKAPDGKVMTYATVKCALSTIMIRNDKTKDLLQETLLFVNQVRLLGCLIGKSFLIEHMKKGSDELSFAPDQSFFLTCMTLASRKKPRTKAEYREALELCAENVLSNFPAPRRPHDRISDSCLSSILNWFAKQLEENLSTHLLTHREDVLEVWLKNEIRGDVISKNPKAAGKDLNDLIKQRQKEVDGDVNDPLGLAFDALNNQMEEMVAEGKVSDKVRRLLPAFYGLQCSAEQLEVKLGTSFKLYSIFPLPKIAISPIVVCKKVMMHLFNSINNQPRVNKDGKPSKYKGPKKLSEDPHDESNWSSLFNMDHVRALRAGDWKFAHNIMTDGVAAWVRFYRFVDKPVFVEDDEEYHTRLIDLTVPGLYKDSNTVNLEQLRAAEIVGLDPGVKKVR